MKKIIDKLILWLSHWDNDKVLHFALCFIISMVAACVCKIFGVGAIETMAAAWFAGFMAGFAKELYDEISHGDSDSRDWLADVLGTTLGTLVSLIFAL